VNGTTHYDVLRVTRDAPPEVIRAAYKALSQKWHPDRNPSPDASAVMQALNTAYAVLSNPSKRADYDRSLHAAGSGSAESNANPKGADRHAASAEAASPHGKRVRAFEVDWEAISRTQREQKRKYRVLGRDSVVAAAKTFGLLFGTIFLLLYISSHG